MISLPNVHYAKNKDNITSFLQLFREYHKGKNEFYYQTPSCSIDMLK